MTTRSLISWSRWRSGSRSLSLFNSRNAKDSGVHVFPPKWRQICFGWKFVCCWVHFLPWQGVKATELCFHRPLLQVIHVWNFGLMSWTNRWVLTRCVVLVLMQYFWPLHQDDAVVFLYMFVVKLTAVNALYNLATPPLRGPGFWHLWEGCADKKMDLVNYIFWLQFILLSLKCPQLA